MCKKVNTTMFTGMQALYAKQQLISEIFVLQSPILAALLKVNLF